MKGFIKNSTVIYLAVATVVFGTGLFLFPFKAEAVVTTKFMEPGGDATFNIALTTAGGFWQTIQGSPSLATDFVHGNHIKSINIAPSTSDTILSPNSIISDTGSRISFYLYLKTLSDFQNNGFFKIEIINGGGGIVLLQFKNDGSGKIQIVDANTGAELGISSSGLTTGSWYRISLAYTITDSTHNRFELFVNGVSAISITNATIPNTVSSTIRFGNFGSDDLQDIRISDIYVDNSSSLTDTGNIWVTAKRPNANGTTNGFTGSGAGSGYGTGNSVYVNERALSTASLVSKVGAGSAVTEEYNIENRSVGDITIQSYDTIVNTEGWAYMSSLVGETVQFILNGVSTAQAITSTNTMYTKVAGSTTYPLGSGTDIGITTDTSLTTVSLFETGVMVAYIPGTPPSPPTVQINGQVNIRGQVLIK